MNQQQTQIPLEETYADQLQATKNLTQEIDSKLAKLQEALIQAADTIANDMGNKTLTDQEFNKLYLTYPEVEVIMIADENKIVRDISPDNTYLSPYLNTKITDPYFNITADSPQLNYGHFQHGNRTVAAVVIPLITSGNEYKGALVTVVDSSLFYQNTIYGFQKNTGYSAWIVDEKGRILYYPERAQYTTDIMQLKSPNQTELNQVLQAILDTKSGVATYSEYNYAKLKITRQAATWDTANDYNKDSNYIPIVVVTSEINSSQQITHPEKSTNMNLEGFVNAAYLFAKENGQTAALAEFNDPNGDFTTEEYYIAAFDMNGTVLSNPYRAEIIGKNRMNFEDANGVHTLWMFTDRALQGGGYVTNVYENPVDDMQTEVKISYVLPVNDEWYITAGEFHPEITAVVPPTVRTDMIQYARSIEVLISENGREAAVASLNNRSHYREDIELNIFDKSGNVIVHDSNAEIVGTNLMGATDIYGTSIIREVMMFAEDGGGFRYTNMPLETKETTEFSLAYVKQIGDDWVLMVSVSMNETE
ncbi:cache domain-containing protein [Methanorbis rubei]|uniref:cache domain-containing protein n=1 Tax=Methanorbis rubei TaxID=3028300 RepID=UPI0030B875A7